jgi:hypothetical protein
LGDGAAHVRDYWTSPDAGGAGHFGPRVGALDFESIVCVRDFDDGDSRAGIARMKKTLVDARYRGSESDGLVNG